MFLIAEIGINHNGDVELAKRMITAAKSAGADAVKFQKRTIDVVYTPEFLDSPRESPWGTTQRDQKQGLELTAQDFIEIDEYCDELDIPWFGSAWDFESFQFLESFDPPYNKIASPMIVNEPFLHTVAQGGKKTFISTGMATELDIHIAVEVFKKYACPVVLMHCVSLYPCPDDVCNLSYIDALYIEYDPMAEIGYSGHETGIMPSLAAYVMGATYIERHFTLDRASYGSDQSASLEPTGLKRLKEYGNQFDAATGDGTKKILPDEAENARKMRYWL